MRDGGVHVLSIVLLLVTAACERAAVARCGEGTGASVDGHDWCALTDEQIAAAGGAVVCPIGTPVALRVGAAALCTDHRTSLDEVPDEVMALFGTTSCTTPLPSDDCLLATHLDDDSLRNDCARSSIVLVAGEARLDPGGRCGRGLRGGDGARAVLVAGDVSLAEHRTITIDVEVLVADPATGGPDDPRGAIYVQQDGEHALYLDDDGHLTAILGTQCGVVAGAPRFHRQLRDPRPFPADGRWHHVTLYADADQRILELYVDRLFAASSEDDGVYCGPIAIPSTGTGARIGGGAIDGTGFPGALLGWVDELSVRRGAFLPVEAAPSGRCVRDAACASEDPSRPLRDRGDRSCVAESSCGEVFACPEGAIGGSCP